MKKLLFLILVLFTANIAFSQIATNVSLKCQIYTSSGTAPTFNVQSLVSDELSKYDGSSVAAGDKLFIIDGSECYELHISSVTLGSGSILNFVAYDSTGTLVTIPTGQAAVIRKYSIQQVPFIPAGLRSDLASCILQKIASTVNSITGGSGVDNCIKTITQAAHGFSEGDVLFWDTDEYVNLEGNYTGAEVPLYVVTDSLTANAFTAASCGEVDSDFGLADGLYYATDTGLELAPEDVEYPAVAVYGSKSKIVLNYGLEFDATGKPLFDIVTVTGQRTIEGGDTMDLHADSIRVNITIADTAATDVGHALELLRNNSGGVANLTLAGSTVIALNNSAGTGIKVGGLDGATVSRLSDTLVISATKLPNGSFVNQLAAWNGTSWALTNAMVGSSTYGGTLHTIRLGAYNVTETETYKGIIAIGGRNQTGVLSGLNTILVGYQTAKFLTTGAGNIFVGSSGCENCPAGLNNSTSIGTNAAKSKTDSGTFTAVGYGAGGTATTINLSTLFGGGDSFAGVSSIVRTASFGEGAHRMANATDVVGIGYSVGAQGSYRTINPVTITGRVDIGSYSGTETGSNQSINIGVYSGYKDAGNANIQIGNRTNTSYFKGDSSIYVGTNPLPTALIPGSAKTTTGLGDFNFSSGVWEITLTSHGFGTGEALLRVTCASCPTGLVNNTTYNFTIVDANTIRSKNTMSSAGDGIVTFTPYVSSSNSIAIGNSLVPEENTIILGRTQTKLKVRNYTWNIDQSLGSGENGGVATYNHSSGEIEVQVNEAKGAINESTDSSGDIVVTHNLGNADVRISHTVNGTTPYVVTVHTRNTNDFKFRVYDMTGAAVASTAVSIDWVAKK